MASRCGSIGYGAGRRCLAQCFGRVITIIASLTTGLGSAGRTLCAGAKAAIGQLSVSLAVERGPYGVAVNAIAPGFIATGLTRYLTDNPALAAPIIQRTPMGRFGRPDDLIDVAVFLAAPAVPDPRPCRCWPTRSPAGRAAGLPAAGQWCEGKPSGVKLERS
jgi:NAD(P)-dependent dehydrogenase (short-subunit alcohol dehydrogenase family)